MDVRNVRILLNTEFLYLEFQTVDHKSAALDFRLMLLLRIIYFIELFQVRYLGRIVAAVG